MLPLRKWVEITNGQGVPGLQGYLVVTNTDFKYFDHAGKEIDDLAYPTADSSSSWLLRRDGVTDKTYMVAWRPNQALVFYNFTIRDDKITLIGTPIIISWNFRDTFFPRVFVHNDEFYAGNVNQGPYTIYDSSGTSKSRTYTAPLLSVQAMFYNLPGGQRFAGAAHIPYVLERNGDAEVIYWHDFTFTPSQLTLVGKQIVGVVANNSYQYMYHAASTADNDPSDDHHEPGVLNKSLTAQNWRLAAPLPYIDRVEIVAVSNPVLRDDLENLLYNVGLNANTIFHGENVVLENLTGPVFRQSLNVQPTRVASQRFRIKAVNNTLTPPRTLFGPDGSVINRLRSKPLVQCQVVPIDGIPPRNEVDLTFVFGDNLYQLDSYEYKGNGLYLMNLVVAE